MSTIKVCLRLAKMPLFVTVTLAGALGIIPKYAQGTTEIIWMVAVLLPASAASALELISVIEDWKRGQDMRGTRPIERIKRERA